MLGGSLPRGQKRSRRAVVGGIAQVQGYPSVEDVYKRQGLMRLPTRLRIGWADPQTLRLETDAGRQTRLFHFDGPKGGAPSWQGDSVASWQKQAQTRGFAPPYDGPAPGKGGALRVVTTDVYKRQKHVEVLEGASDVQAGRHEVVLAN